MTLKVGTFFPARVPKLNESLLVIRRQVEGDFSPLPLVYALAFRGFPDDTLSRRELLDIKFLAELTTEPKFERVTHLRTAAPCVRCPPQSELRGLGQRFVDALRGRLNADLMIDSVAHFLRPHRLIANAGPCWAALDCETAANFSGVVRMKLQRELIRVASLLISGRATAQARRASAFASLAPERLQFRRESNAPAECGPHRRGKRPPLTAPSWPALGRQKGLYQECLRQNAPAQNRPVIFAGEQFPVIPPA